MTVLRDGVEKVLHVKTALVDGSGTVMDLLVWNGLCLHTTYTAIKQLG